MNQALDKLKVAIYQCEFKAAKKHRSTLLNYTKHCQHKYTITNSKNTRAKHMFQ